MHGGCWQNVGKSVIFYWKKGQVFAKYGPFFNKKAVFFAKIGKKRGCGAAIYHVFFAFQPVQMGKTCHSWVGTIHRHGSDLAKA